MVGSLLISLAKQYMPISIKDTNTTSEILQLFPEITEHYGDTIETDLEINFPEESGEVFRLSNLTGIEIGKENKTLSAELIIKCKNANMSDYETAVQFDFGLEAIANVSIDSKWKLYLNIPNIAISNVKISNNRVGMISRHYDNLLTSIARSFVSILNADWTRPFDITSLDPMTLPFVSNMLKDLHVTPFLENEFFYIGFTYFMDPNPQTVQSFNYQTNAIAEKHSDKILKMFDIIANWYNNSEKQEFIATQ